MAPHPFRCPGEPAQRLPIWKQPPWKESRGAQWAPEPVREVAENRRSERLRDLPSVTQLQRVLWSQKFNPSRPSLQEPDPRPSASRAWTPRRTTAMLRSDRRAGTEPTYSRLVERGPVGPSVSTPTADAAERMDDSQEPPPGAVTWRDNLLRVDWPSGPDSGHANIPGPWGGEGWVRAPGIAASKGAQDCAHTRGPARWLIFCPCPYLGRAPDTAGRPPHTHPQVVAW